MDAQPGELFRVQGRGSGLMSNPVYYGSVMAGIAAVWTGLACERVSRYRIGLCALLAFVAGLSGCESVDAGHVDRSGLVSVTTT